MQRVFDAISDEIVKLENERAGIDDKITKLKLVSSQLQFPTYVNETLVEKPISPKVICVVNALQNAGKPLDLQQIKKQIYKDTKENIHINAVRGKVGYLRRNNILNNIDGKFTIRN